MCNCGKNKKGTPAALAAQAKSRSRSKSQLVVVSCPDCITSLRAADGRWHAVHNTKTIVTRGQAQQWQQNYPVVIENAN